MSLTASEVLSHRDMSALTHFGEHEQKFYLPSSPVTHGKREIENIVSMPVEIIFETEKEMNCLDILAGVVSRCSSSEIEQKPLLCTMAIGRTEQICRPTTERSDSATAQEHRVSCHRCGNIRKRKIVCERPQVCINHTAANFALSSLEVSFPNLYSTAFRCGIFSCHFILTAVLSSSNPCIFFFNFSTQSVLISSVDDVPIK